MTTDTLPNIEPKINDEWKDALNAEFSADYFRSLKAFILREKQQFDVFPPGPKIFSAFDRTPLSKIKAVIIGQDPYHGPGQANGLCFSVADGVPKPPSLKNIFKELNQDLGVPTPTSGNLEKWADQGVLLLNATLTVRRGQAGAHQGRGWEQFTDAVIKTVSEKRENVVFILWGRFAQQKIQLIDLDKHHVIQSTHPSPFSARNGFFGSRPFSRTNELLKQHGIDPIDWNPTT